MTINLQGNAQLVPRVQLLEQVVGVVDSEVRVAVILRGGNHPFVHLQAYDDPQRDIEAVHYLANDVHQVVWASAEASTPLRAHVVDQIPPVHEQEDNKGALESEANVVGSRFVHVADLERLDRDPLVDAATEGEVESDYDASVDVDVAVVEEHLHLHLLRAVVKPLFFLQLLHRAFAVVHGKCLVGDEEASV